MNRPTPERADREAPPIAPPSPSENGRQHRPTSRVRQCGFGSLLLLVALFLAWHDVLPGGWRLRGWVVPHAVRRAEAQASHSAERMSLFAGENASAPAGSIVCLGSSTVEYFPFDTAFPGRPALDRGIAGETAGELLARLHESLPATQPAAALVYAGSLDFRREGASPAEVARRVEGVLLALRARVPDLPIALIGLLPERDMEPEFAGRLILTNRRLNALATGLGVAFVSTERPPLTTCDGRLDPDYSVDRWHLNGAGYAQLSAWILRDGGEAGRLLAPH